MIATPHPVKSSTLRVATEAPAARAIAAICASKIFVGLLGENFAVMHRGVRIKNEETPGKILLEHALRIRRQVSLAATVGQERDAVEHLRHCDARRE